MEERQWKVDHVQNLLNSFEALTNKKIIERGTPEEDLKRVEESEFVLVSHNGAEDPILNYGNQFALNLWELDWNAFTQTPSRKTAEADLRERRQVMLEIAKKQGYFDNYEGIRISSTGKRFKIKKAIVWSVTDEQGNKIGQAAYFNEIEHL